MADSTAATGRALITGASAGIGEALARRLAARGFALVLSARRRQRLEALAAELGKRHGVAVEVIEADLSREGMPAEVARLAARGGDVDLLVNNAGAGAFGAFSDLPLDAQLGQIRLNLVALVELCGLLLPAMRARGRGAILNVASTAGFQPLAYNAVYAASKAFVVSFGEALAVELSGSGVQVVTFCPGVADTEFFAAARRVGEAFRPSRLVAMSADRVADHAMRALDRRQALAFAGLRNWCTTFVVRLFPRAWVRVLAGRIFRRMLSWQRARR